MEARVESERRWRVERNEQEYGVGEGVMKQAIKKEEQLRPDSC